MESPDYSEHEFDIDAEIEAGIEVEADFDEQDGPTAAAAQPAAAAAAAQPAAAAVAAQPAAAAVAGVQVDQRTVQLAV